MNTATQAAISWMRARQTEMVDTTIRWCDQNSWSSDPDSLGTMAGILQSDFDGLGLAFQSFVLPSWTSIGDDGEPITRPTGPALVWHHNDTAQRRILLMIHYDTVYTHHAITGQTRRKQNRLIGPGVADAKGGIAVIRFAIEAVLRHGLAPGLGISILLNPDEEIGSPSSTPLMKQMASQYKLACLFEPTLPDGSLVADRKGTANITFVVRGKSAHVGRNFSDGRNAILHAARLAIELDNWNDDLVTLNAGRLIGGLALNQVPDMAILGVNIRMANASLLERLSQRLSDIQIEYSSDGFTCQLHGGFHSPPKCIDAASFQIVRGIVEYAMISSDREVRWRDTGGACDGNKLAAFGLPNIDSLGVTGGNLHSPDEYADIESFVPAAETLIRIIDRAAQTL